MTLDGTTAAFAKAPLTFLRHVTIMPPAEKPTYRTDVPIPIEETSLRFFSRERRDRVTSKLPQITDRYRSSYVEMPIAWIRFKGSPDVKGALTFDVEYAPRKPDATDYTDVTPEFEERIIQADRLPVFYLPWQPDHLVRLSIPRYRAETVMDFGSSISIDPYCPHIFFTAMLSGCSVFVHGDPRQPTVVHAGTGSKGTPYGDESAVFWRELLTLERFRRLQYDGWAREVNADHYMGDTATRERFERWLETQPRKFEVTYKVLFGAVFGIRYGALWSFYLQENAVVYRRRIERRRRRVEVEKPIFLGLGTRRVSEIRTYEVTSETEESIPVPLSVRPFFPTGGGRVALWDMFTRTYR